MSETKWTPGPWRVADRKWKHDNYGFREVESSSPFWIAHVLAFDDGPIDPEPAEYLANAHLIASAPDLYATLANFVEEAESWHSLYHGNIDFQCDALCEAIAPGKAALAKARGEA